MGDTSDSNTDETSDNVGTQIETAVVRKRENQNKIHRLIVTLTMNENGNTCLCRLNVARTQHRGNHCFGARNVNTMPRGEQSCIDCIDWKNEMG